MAHGTVIVVVWCMQLREVISEYERRKAEMEHQQTTAIHQLMTETEDKLNAMQGDYDQMMQSTVCSTTTTTTTTTHYTTASCSTNTAIH